MKEYKEAENKPMSAGEPQAAYLESSRGERLVSSELMDELTVCVDYLGQPLSSMRMMIGRKRKKLI